LSSEIILDEFGAEQM